MEKTVTLNKNFYPPELIQKAIEDYAKVCKIEQDDDKLIFYSNMENVEYEFANYVLSLMRG